MKGIIGFFDILGYQNLLENNSAIESAIEVIQIIKTLPKDVNTSFNDSEFNQFHKKIANDIKHIVFSDTIILALEYPLDEKDEIFDAIHLSASNIMLLACSSLKSKLFANGLPSRGVIHEGEFLIDEHCLAGVPIVKAYKLCQELNLSGLVCTDTFSDKYKKILKTDSIAESLLFDYLTPLKKNEERMFNVNWMKYSPNINDIDIDDFVYGAFSFYEKDCPNAVNEKMFNTTKSIRKMKQIIFQQKNATKE